MNIKQFFEYIPRGEKMAVREKIANKLDVGESAIGHWINGSRKVAVNHMYKLQKITKEISKNYNINGYVTAKESRPDIFQSE